MSSAGSAGVLPLGSPIHVRKLRPDGSQAFAWDGVVLRCNEHGIVLRAQFNVDLVDLGFTTFRRGDDFVEFYYFDPASPSTSNPHHSGVVGDAVGGASELASPRFYNVFQVSSPDGTLKGWYTNVALPAQLDVASHQLQYVDLELDLWVHPDGSFIVLDQDDFDALVREHPELADAAHQGRTELLNLAQSGDWPRWPE